MTKPLSLNPKQKDLLDLIAGPATYILANGGSRSGKTFALCYAALERGISAPGMRTGIFRSTLKDCVEKVFLKSFMEVMQIARPGLLANCIVNKSHYTITLPNGPDPREPHMGGSVFIFGGLDDNGRLDSVLGDEYATIWLNEISDFQYSVFSQLQGRLAQLLNNVHGQPVRPKFFCDQNPTSTKHWSYLAWVLGLNPGKKTPLAKPEKWAWIQINADDNKNNIVAGYEENLRETSTAKDIKRLADGQWQSEVEGALFQADWIDDNRISDDKFDREKLTRIVVAVDPATSNNPGSDETGVVVAGIDDAEIPQAYVLADLSGRYSPEEWARIAAQAYEDYGADVVVYERNQGGAMVETTLRTANSFLPTKDVWASRGKEIRAEPISLIYSKNRVSHVGEFPVLEEQMVSFTHGFNRTKQGSPDRLDALVWALSELMTEKQHTPSPMTVAKVGGFYG